MLSALKTPSIKDFFMLLARGLVYTIPLYLITKIFSSLRGGITEMLLGDMVMLIAAFPAARKLGFRFGDIKVYLRGFKPEIRPAFKYFLVITALLWVGDYVYTMALAPWDLPWTNTLLSWNDASNNPATSAAHINAVLNNPPLFFEYFLTVCVFPPIIEEFIMRRWLYVAMRKVMPVAAAMLINGALFGLLHGKDFMSTAVHGCLLCWVYERTERLWTPVLAHSFGNVYVLLTLFGGKLL